MGQLSQFFQNAAVHPFQDARWVKAKYVCAAFLCMSLLILGMTTIDAVAAADNKTDEVQSETEAKEWKFEPFAKDQRDPFYNLEEVALAERDLEAAIEEEREQREGANDGDVIDDGPDRQVIPEGAHEIDIALAKSREHANNAEQSLLELDWQAAVNASQKGIEVLSTVGEFSEHPKYKKVLAQQELLNGYLNNAKEAQMNQIVEERFNALNLQVQGIMWSADKKSLAIISGRHVYVQDTIGEGKDTVTIVNIDPNRVDFMINHERRRFEF